MTAIETGLGLVLRAIDDEQAVEAAVQTLRNWQHRLDKLTVLDGAGRNDVQQDLHMIGEVLREIHYGDPAFRPVRESTVRERLSVIESKLIRLVGLGGLD